MSDFQDLPVPIRCLARREACRNTKMVMFFDTLESERHRVDSYMVLESLHYGSGLDSGVSVLPVVGSRVGLQRVYRHPIAKWVWEVPRGFIDEGEMPLQAAARELEEESGLVCTLEDLRALGAVTPEAGVIRARILLFAALNCRFIGRCDDGSEPGIGALLWFGLEEALAMADRGDIEDATTVVALYRLARFTLL